jgi:hypothetical protein
MLFWHAELFHNRYISVIRSQTDQVFDEFAAYSGEMYPVGLCLHILPGASLHVCSGFLVGPVSECLGAFRFFFSLFLIFATFPGTLDFAAPEPRELTTSAFLLYPRFLVIAAMSGSAGLPRLFRVQLK